jgi:gluconolactonase
VNYQRTLLAICTGLIFSNHTCAQDQEIIAKDAELTLVSADFEFTEGPAASEDGNVYFTDQPNNRILKWTEANNSVEVYLEDAGRANGLYFDNDGNLLACADENSELWKIGNDKNVQVLVSDYNGQRLNGPNDLWIDPKGGVYITDPYYQRPYWERTEKEIQEERVYYLAPGAKELKIVANDLEKPNGIIGTPDGKTLYVADIGAGKTWSYTMAEDGSLGNKTLFTNLGSDGMTIDEQGNIYLTGEGVTVFNSRGDQIEHIPVDRDWTANVTFAGKDRKTLFITAMNSVFTLEMNVKGVR